MKRDTLGRIGTVGLLLGTATVACTPNSHVASASQTPVPRLAARAGHEADKARAAIAKHKGDAAVKAAEKAVALAPNNADDRMLLGQAYLIVGRFASAETAFGDSLALSPDQPRARFNLALAQIAGGKGAVAQATLAPLAGRVADSDLGLALALAGDNAGAIKRLGDLVRAGKSDARARQNLALTLALGGHWDEARAVAMQDTPPDRLSDQIASWAELAKPGQSARRIAAMLGTTPAAADPGLPAQLALAAPTAAAPVALALAAPAPAVAPAAAAMPVGTAPEAAPQGAPAVPTLIAAATASDIAATDTGDIVPPALIRAPEAPTRTALSRSVAPGPELVARRQGGFVVQLGAFSKAGAIDAAWDKAARLTPNVVRFTPVRGSTSLSGATLVRLSVGGFATREAAKDLCTKLKARGQACFVRGLGNDAPLQWVRKDTGKTLQLASL